MVAALTFQEVREANVARAKRWHPGFPSDDDWSLGDWSNAMCGEAGESANIVKKLRRFETGKVGGPVVLEKDSTSEASLNQQLAHELADVFLYLQLLAEKRNIDLPRAIMEKFNLTSDNYGFPEKIRD